MNLLARRRDVIGHAIGVSLIGLSSGLVAAPATPPTLVVLGDSLSAEYGIARGSGWVALLEARLRAQRKPHRVVNASISGDTTAGGRARLPAVLRQHRPSHVVIELGGNDALRGLPLANTRDNLVAMVREVRGAGAKPLLVGMRVPPNFGARYAQEFASSFGQVARQEAVPLVPFLLSGFAEREDAEQWFQPDRIHPLARAHPLMLDAVWPVLQKTL